ncbi:hypothetical protein EJ110_NYTH22500 [Nymphaea thermarum]|nr:hypothetical protein EJ110_NYTH22500 [Nymphaea thermarum]
MEDGRAYRFLSWPKNQPRFCANSVVFNQSIKLVGMIGDSESMTGVGILSRRATILFLGEEPLGQGFGCSRCADRECGQWWLPDWENDLKDLRLLLIGAKCRNGVSEDARCDEMRRMGCDANVKSYNFLLGSLCKYRKIAESCELIGMMEHAAYRPDEMTCEIIAYHACRIERMDFATDFLDRMPLEALRPRFTTHTAFVKGYFYCGQVHGAHRFVAETCNKAKSSANMNYSLLASLFQKPGKSVD